MPAKSKKSESTQLAVPSPQGALIDQEIDQVLWNPDEELQIDQALLQVQHRLETLNPDETGPAFPALQLTLQSLWNFLQGTNIASKQGNYLEAMQFYDAAANGFAQVGKNDLRDLAAGLGIYTRAVVELRKLNIGEALSLMDEGKKVLRQAGKYSQAFEPIIDMMQPDAFFVAGIESLQKSDMVTGKQLIEKASQTAQQVAEQYFDDGDSLHSLFMGTAHLYRAIGSFHMVTNDLNRFAYDNLINEEQLEQDALRAREFLSDPHLKTEIARQNKHLASVLANLIMVMRDLAKELKAFFTSNNRPSPQTLEDIRKQIRVASKSASEAGEAGVPYVHICEQFLSQVNNFEDLAKPLPNPYFGKPTKATTPTDVFVLMPFHKSFQPVYEDHMKNAAKSLGLSIARADDFFTAHTVMSDVWAAISNARIIIADCTKRNPNVFYEIGLAHVIGKPVILIAQSDNDVPFDVRHLRYIKYDYTPRGMKSFEENLKTTLQTELSLGAPTAAISSAKSKSSGTRTKGNAKLAAAN